MGGRTRARRPTRAYETMTTTFDDSWGDSMPAPFKGTINTDIRDSVEDWTPFVAPAAPDGAPNVIYVVLDDVGFSAMSCYGGPIATPNIDKIAADGVRYTQWHTTALCSPTRSCLLTGRNHTRNSMACITEGASGFPNASGTIPPENGMLPEILGERGWNTYMVGKWHLCPTVEMNLASTRRNWPTGRGFERFYGFLGAETSQWFPELIYDNHPVDQPKTPDEGYHFGEDITDKAIEFIMDAKAVAPDKPFFLYYAPGAAHAPHHAPKDWIDKYKGQFDMGYEAMREATLARQKAMGLVPADTELPPINPLAGDHRAGRTRLPGRRPDPAVGLTVRGGAASVRTDGRGVRRVPVARRPPGRPPARLSRDIGPAREHDRHRRLRQRRQRRRRTERIRQRDAVHERHRRRHRCQPRDDRRAWWAQDLQPLPERLGDGVQYAVQDVEALRVQRRDQRPVHHLVAVRDRHRRARSERSITTRSTWSRPSWTSSASTRRRRSRGTPRATSTA